jgi:hypothetical protein
MSDMYTSQRASLVITDKSILSLERMLHDNYDRRGQLQKEKISGCEPQEAWRQDKLTGSKLPVVK